MTDIDLSVLADDRLRAVVERAVEHQREHEDTDQWQEYDHTGFEASDVRARGWELPQLVNAGVFDKVYDSNSSNYYRVTDLDAVEDALEATAYPEAPDDDTAEEADPLDPEDLFEDVVGREEPKTWIRRTIENGADVHHLLVGEPGSGKSMILDDVAELPGAERVVMSGSQSSAAGIVDVLKREPDYLVVEEIEKGTKADREALMTLCGQGYIKETKADREGRKIKLDTTVIAAGNQRDKITPPSLVDRFMLWTFEQYDIEEYRNVCSEVLPPDHDIDEALAETIAEQVFDRLDSSSVREAERIASLAEDEDEVSRLIDAMR